MIKTYQKYLSSNFIQLSFKITFIFIVLGLIMGILEELNFFSDTDVEYYFPFFLVFLNLPSVLYEIFPFIFLISSQFFFIRIIDNEELNTFKNNGLNNTKILKLLTLISFMFGITIVTVFYNFSATLKFIYLDIKKNFTKDNKYLATVTENGLWIKDETKGNINFINAQKFSINSLDDIDIIVLDSNFEFKKNIRADNANIEKNDWKLYNVIIIDDKNIVTEKKNLIFNSNFNYNEISNLFSNLSSLTYWELYELQKNYKSVNYSTTEIQYHWQKIIAYPFLITIIVLLSSILMMNIKFKGPRVFVIVFGILLSVTIYYINFFFGTMGKNEKIPILISVWSPILIMFIISLIGLVRINEK